MGTLKVQFDEIVRLYIEAFTKKQEMYFEYWVGDNIGGICEVSGFFFNFDDIRYDIDNFIAEGQIIEWYDETLESEQNINYKNWLKMDKK